MDSSCSNPASIVCAFTGGTQVPAGAGRLRVCRRSHVSGCVTRLNHNMGKNHDVLVASFELVWKDGA
jgi:hypothetical protein